MPDIYISSLYGVYAYLFYTNLDSTVSLYADIVNTIVVSYDTLVKL